MQLKLENVSKKYKNSWILKDVNLELNAGDNCAIIGNNGSGKSTLLKIISGYVTPTQGKVYFGELQPDTLYQSISYSAPYIELIEELTLLELLQYTKKFKPFLAEFSVEKLLAIFNFPEDKMIKDYSSGMKQRVKLLLALNQDVQLTLFDEPFSNLDEEGIDWFLKSIKSLPKERIIIVASNDKREYEFCDKQINVLDYK